MKICIEGMNEGFLVRLLEFFKERDIRVSSVIRTSEYNGIKRYLCYYGTGIETQTES